MKLDKTNAFFQELQTVNHVYTHSGKFHADDVFSFALLRILNPDIQVHRVNEVLPEHKGIIFDIGWGEFDHHQKDAKVRENSVPYAAFGLLWKQAGTAFFTQKAADKFDEKFIQPLDLNDNTGEPDTIAALIGDFNPAWNQKKDLQEEFLKAADFAEKILVHKIEHIQSNEVAKDIVEPYVKSAQDGILVLDQYVPWRKAIENTSVAFVVFPSDRGGYNAMTVKDDVTKEAKIDFCEEWYGKSKEELIRLSNVATLRFCHKAGFLIATDNKEDAIMACKLSINAQTPALKWKKKLKFIKMSLLTKKVKR